MMRLERTTILHAMLASIIITFKNSFTPICIQMIAIMLLAAMLYPWLTIPMLTDGCLSLCSFFYCLITVYFSISFTLTLYRNFLLSAEKMFWPWPSFSYFITNFAALTFLCRTLLTIYLLVVLPFAGACVLTL